jgi:hypothetical protein
MMQDIDQMLSIEVKKEIADRYFGFRKLIEEDIQAYDDMVISSFRGLEQKIGFDLVRLYTLLKDRTLIHDFFHILGLDERLFYDPYVNESPTIRKRILAGRTVHGLTRKNRFRNLIFDTYEELEHHIIQYLQTLEELREEHETISEEIKLFYKKNDLGVIMGFLRGLGGGGSVKSGPMEGGLQPKTGESLEKKMRVHPPKSVEELLPKIPAIPPLKEIKNELKPIIDKAFERQGEPEMRAIVHP